MRGLIPTKKARAATLAAAVILSTAAGTSYALMKSHVWQPNLLLAGGGVQGVDLSEHQGEVDFDALGDAGIEFAYLKATEGSSHVDSQFARSWEEANSRGIPVGAYHFFSYDSLGEAQAEHFLSTVGDMSGHLIPAVDIEWYGNKAEDPPSEEDMYRELHAFLDAVEGACGRKPLIYGGQNPEGKGIALQPQRTSDTIEHVHIAQLIISHAG